MQQFKACIAVPNSKPMVGFYVVISESEKAALKDFSRAVPGARGIDLVRHDRPAAVMDLMPGEVRRIA